MALSEFDLIRRYFSQTGIERKDVPLGVGDDCALLRVPDGYELATTIDTLVEGVHFLPEIDPASLGYKSLAVNLSDLASMGAQPAWISLALTLPQSNDAWLEAFCSGFFELARQHDVQLIGGDTTRGPLNISVQAFGFVQAGKALRRDGAKPGDLIYVTGTLGDAALAHHYTEHPPVDDAHLPYLQSRLDRPMPRVYEGKQLQPLATGAIDISDGLIADLGHICEDSGVGASVELSSLPCSPAMQQYLTGGGDWMLPLAWGDDYELCVTVSPENRFAVEALEGVFSCDLSCIGTIESTPGLRVIQADGSFLETSSAGYEHFSSNG